MVLYNETKKCTNENFPLYSMCMHTYQLLSSTYMIIILIILATYVHMLSYTVVFSGDAQL